MTKKKPNGLHACALCGETYANNVHLARHLERNHSLQFQDYEWFHIQGRADQPLCAANCGRLRASHNGRYLKFCSSECARRDYKLTDDGRRRKIERLTTHDHSRTGIYRSWVAMLDRCQNSENRDWKYYGGRGVKVCDQWLEFENFLADMGERPAGKTLDRYPDNDGDYKPNNCRWATPKEQQANRRDRRRFEGQPEMKGHG